MLKILVLTTSFPRHRHDYKACFILDLVKRFNVEKLLALTPHSPQAKLIDKIDDVEAMAGNKAIISTRVGLARDLLTDGESCLFIRKENSEDIIKAVTRFLENPSEITRLGKNAGEIIKRKKLTWEAAVDQYMNIFQKVAALNN